MSTDTDTAPETIKTFTCGHCGSAEDDIDVLIDHVSGCEENDHTRSGGDCR